MENMILPVILGVLVGVAIGFIIFRSIEKAKGKKMLDSTRKDAATILKEAKIDAESVKKDKILQAKEKFIELKSEHEKVILSREKKISDVEKRIRDRESKVASEVDKNKRLNQSLEQKEKDYNFKLDFLENKENDLEKMHKRHVDMLEQISGLSAEEAKKELVTSLKDEAKSDAMAFVQTSIEEAKLTAEQEARKVVLGTIQRVGV
jgi:ribonuclease Y